MNGTLDSGSGRRSAACGRTLALLCGAMAMAGGHPAPSAVEPAMPRGLAGIGTPAGTRCRTGGTYDNDLQSAAATCRRPSRDNTVANASPDRRATDGNAIGANGGPTLSLPAYLRYPNRFLYFSIARRATAARRAMSEYHSAVARAAIGCHHSRDPPGSAAAFVVA